MRRVISDTLAPSVNVRETAERETPARAATIWAVTNVGDFLLLILHHPHPGEAVGPTPQVGNECHIDLSLGNVPGDGWRLCGWLVKDDRHNVCSAEERRVDVSIMMLFALAVDAAVYTLWVQSSYWSAGGHSGAVETTQFTFPTVVSVGLILSRATFPHWFLWPK